jgi:hypothetical protein
MTTRLRLASLLLCLVAATTHAHAGVTLFLEEPYSYDGAFAGTGHAAVYLTRICAESPLVLRRCAPGELGAVISRYDGIAGHDWIAMPLIPYLYAVEKPENVPLSADEKVADFLRDQYRRTHLQSIAPDGRDGQPPSGRWPEPLGVAYRRTIYGFQIETTEEQDDQLIRKYNSAPNRDKFNLVTHNCADFARNLINSYYPKVLHRSIVRDLGVTTPKQMARLLVNFGQRHPKLHPSSFVIPQVPGNIRRSGPVRGIVESAFRAKKYMVPLLVVHPVMATCFVVGAVGVGHFNPARDAMVFDPSRELQPPVTSAQRRDYQNRLDAMKAPLAEGNPWSEVTWQRLEADAVPRLDDSGAPILQVKVGAETLDLGLSRNNILTSSAPPELTERIVLLRLRDELKSGNAPKVSKQDIGNDWELLQQVLLARRRKTDENETRLTAMRTATP